MIKCYFIDVKNISSTVPRSNFAEADLAQLADLILATGGLLRPLILGVSGVEQYTVVEGHREYYATLKAKEKNSIKAEMVNAFVINSDNQQSAIDQLSLINEDKTIESLPLADPTPAIVDRLLPVLLSAISLQLQPIISQLTEQKQLLDRLTHDLHQISSSQQVDLPKPPDSQPEPVPTPITVVDPKPVKVPPLKPPKIPATNSKVVKEKELPPAKPPKTPATNSKAFAFLDSIDPTKKINTLILLNTLSQAELQLRMERSGISKLMAKKLAVNIIDSRNIQPDQKFDTWETIVTAKIPGFATTKITEVIEKLK